MNMPGRTFSAGTSYRYGFNGKENSPEISSGAVSFEARIYDARIGRFFSTDPREAEYAWQSTYVYFKNCPTNVLDVMGMGGIEPLPDENNPDPPNDAVPTTAIEIRNSLKPATNGATIVSSYFVLYVDMPMHGDPTVKSDLSGSPGHTFIKLGQKFSDNSVREAIFGFYPSRKNGKGNPWSPTSGGIFKNNENHEFDVKLTKGITSDEFNNILALTEVYEKLEYDLRSLNCSDFGLAAANVLGIYGLDGEGWWAAPFANYAHYQKGTNPANLGTNMIVRKLEYEKLKPGITIHETPFSGETSVDFSYTPFYIQKSQFDWSNIYKPNSNPNPFYILK